MPTEAEIETVSPRPRSRPPGDALRAVVASKAGPAALIVLAALLLCLPMLVFGFPNGHDARLHMVWHDNFARQFAAGEPYPRWLRDVGWGLGGPVFYFYPPIGFHVSALASQLFAADPLGIRALAVAATAALAISGLTAYLWLRTMAGRTASTVGAVVYMVVPYHLAIDLYLRTAYAEFWAFAWMPAILFFISRLGNGGLGAVAGLALSYGLLVATHLPTTLLFSPFALIYAVHVHGRRGRPLAGAATGLALGTLLAAAYLLPSVALLDTVSSGSLWRDFRYAFSPSDLFGKLFDPAEKARYGSINYFVFLHLALLFPALLLRAVWFARVGADADGRRRFRFSFLSAAVCFVLVTPLAAPVWETIPFLTRVQFSWRLYAVLSLAMLPMCAIAIDRLAALDETERRDRKRFLAVILGAGLVVTVGAAVHPQRYDRIDTTVRVGATSGLVEFLPRDAVDGLAAATDLDYAISQMYRRTWPRARLIGEGTATVERWEAGNIAVRVASPVPTRLVVGQFYYPFWTARRDGTCCLETRADRAHALLEVSVPAGDHAIELTLGAPPIQRAGERISVAAALIIALLMAGHVLLRGRRTAPRGEKTAA